VAEHLLALDLGTTGVRALALHASGEVKGRAWQPLAARSPFAGSLEQDPLEMWQRSLEVMRQALALAGLEAADIEGLGVVNQRSTALAWDAQTGAPLCSAIGWQDIRTAPRVAEMVSAGIPVNTLASCTKFEWLLANDARVAEAAKAGRLRLGTPDTWLTLKLTGGEALVTDPGNAACTGLLDPASLDWSPGILGLFGLEADWFAEVVPTAEVVAQTPIDLLGGAIPVAARAGDQQAASFAQSVFLPGESKFTLGTSAMLNVHVGPSYQEPPAGSHGLPLWQLPEHGTAFCFEGNVVTAGAIVDWLVQIGLLESPGALDAVCRGVVADHGVVFVPAFQGLGTPFLDDSARGFVAGLTRGSGAGELVHAAIVGIAHRCVDVIDSLPVGAAPLRVDGGLAQSRVLLQKLADLAGREVLRAAETETTAVGAALLAALPVGLLDSPAAIRERVQEPERFEPQTDEASRGEARRHWRRALTRARGLAAAAPD